MLCRYPGGGWISHVQGDAEVGKFVPDKVFAGLGEGSQRDYRRLGRK